MNTRIIRTLFTATVLVGTLTSFDHPEKPVQVNTQKQPILGFNHSLANSTIQKDLKQREQAKLKAQRDKERREKERKKAKNYKELSVTATAYVSYCDTGCTGVTATGWDVSQSIYSPKGYGIIAVDPSVIPLGSVVEIGGRKYEAIDTGGAIKGHRIDILVAVRNTNLAFDYGKQNIKIKVLKNID